MSEDRSQSFFVGRDRELDELLRRLDDAASGRGRLVLVGGEPGIGKSRLADALSGHARERGYRVMWGRGWDDAGAPAYWPWVQAIRPYLRNTDPAALRRQLGAGAGDIARMLPEVGAIVPELPAPRPTDPESARFRLFDSTAAFLITAACEQPLLLVIDDLHAADTASILLLRFLASQLADTQILLVATYRDVELTSDHPLRAALPELIREPATQVLTLRGLSETAVAEFIEGTAGIRPRTQLATVMWRETAGNPLFLGEAVRLLGTEGRLEQVSELGSLRLAVPAGIRNVIARRVAQLPDASADVVRYAAVMGREFSVEALRRVGGYEPDDLVDLLDEPIRAGLLAPVSGVFGRLRFSHDLVRETLYDELSPARRMRLHRRIGEVLEELYAAGAERHLAELAHHFYEGGQVGDTHKAADYARRAASQAAKVLAYEEAARLYRIALRAVDAEPSPDDAIRAELLLSLGDAEARSGDLVSARGTFLAAATIARRIGDARQLARAALGYGGRFIWTRVGRDPHLIPLLSDALRLLDGADARLRVRLLARLACAWRSSPGHRERSAALSQEAVEIARALDDPATLSYALVGRYWATYWPENPDERLGTANELLAVAEAAGDAERTVDAHQILHATYAELGMMPEAKQHLEIVERAAEELRQPVDVRALATYRSVLTLLEGAYDRAEELIEGEVRPGQPINPIDDDVSEASMHRFLLRREQGRLAEEESTVRAVAEEFPWYPFHRAALACLLIDLGRLDEARSVFDELARDGARALYHDSQWLLGVSLASEACFRLGDADAAQAFYDQLRPFAGRHAIGHGAGSVGSVDRYLGLLATTLGRLDDAQRHFEDAIRMSERMGAAPWTAHAQADFAEMLLRRDAPGDRARAVGLARAAQATAEHLGMTTLRARLHRTATPAPPRDERSPAETRSGVFRKDGEYWTVAFDGQSFRMRDAKGMRYLARLLATPGAEIHVLDLVAGERDAQPVARAAGHEPGGDGLDAFGFGDAGEVLDAEAREAYRERLRELEAETAEAEAWNDPERVSRLRGERDMLVGELAAAVGLGGRSRIAASAAERARLSVGKAIRASLQRIETHSASLGRHLALSVHTGTFCSYTPDPSLSLTWEL